MKTQLSFTKRKNEVAPRLKNSSRAFQQFNSRIFFSKQSKVTVFFAHAYFKYFRASTDFKKVEICELTRSYTHATRVHTIHHFLHQVLANTHAPCLLPTPPINERSRPDVHAPRACTYAQNPDTRVFVLHVRVMPLHDAPCPYTHAPHLTYTHHHTPRTYATRTYHAHAHALRHYTCPLRACTHMVHMNVQN